MPRDRPSEYVAMASDNSMTISGLVKNRNVGSMPSGITWNRLSSSDNAIRNTGSNAVAKQLKALGSSLSGRIGAMNKVKGFADTLRNSFANIGPAMIMAGSA